jgi:hypothetical protein
MILSGFVNKLKTLDVGRSTDKNILQIVKIQNEEERKSSVYMIMGEILIKYREFYMSSYILFFAFILC